jgi:predicted nucleic acid-binding protein
LIVYFDSSVLLKLFLDEPDAQIALDIWNEAEDVVTSEISYLEVRAGLARAMRENPPRLSATGYDDAKTQFDQLWSQVLSITVTADLIDQASDVAEKHALRAYDALQFATVLSVADDGIILATTDQDLERAARAAGIPLTQLSSTRTEASGVQPHID